VTVQSAQARPRFFVALPWFLALSTILLLDCSKGFWKGVQGWGVPYWFIDYHNGFVRRGLVGQLFQMVFGRLSVDRLTAPVMAINLAAIGALVLASALVAARTVAQIRLKHTLGYFAFAAWVFAAQVWPTLTYNVGYLDVLVVLIATAAALLFRSGRIVETGVLIALGPFVHEYFVFLVPFVLTAGLPEIPDPAPGEEWPLDYVRPGPSNRTLLLLGGVGLISGAVVTLSVNAAATISQIERMPVTADMKHVLETVSFTQSMGQSFNQMMDLLFRDPGYTAFNALFFLLPAFAACIGLLFWRARPNRLRVWKVVAGLFPVLALLLAWDLSRLLVLADFTAGFLFLLAAASRAAQPSVVPPARATGWMGPALAAVSIIAAVGYAGLPFIYAYFEPGPALFRYPIAIDQSRPVQYIKGPLAVAWGGHRPAKADLTCALISTDPDGKASADCSRTMSEGEALSVSTPLARGAYRFQADLEPTGACSAGRVAFQVALDSVQAPVAHEGFALGGRITAQLDVLVADDQSAALAQIVDIAGNGCARVRQLTITSLPQAH
jgi:hypothetical protein